MAALATSALRTVDELTEDEIRGFLPQTAPLVHREINSKEMRVDLVPEGKDGDEPTAQDEPTKLPIAGHEKVFLDLSKSDLLTSRQLCDTVINAHFEEVFRSVPFGREWSDKTIEFGRQSLVNYRVLVEDQKLVIDRLAVVVGVRQFPSALQLTRAVTYAAGTDHETVVATWQGDPDSNIREMSVLLRKQAPPNCGQP